MNCCKLEQVGTQGNGKMLKRFLILEDGRVLVKEANFWNIDGQIWRVTRKEDGRLLNEFEMGFFYGTERSVESRQR